MCPVRRGISRSSFTSKDALENSTRLKFWTLLRLAAATQPRSDVQDYFGG